MPRIAVPRAGAASVVATPAMSSAAARPWRLASPAIVTRVGAPSRWSIFSTPSPTAQMDGSLVR